MSEPSVERVQVDAATAAGLTALLGDRRHAVLVVDGVDRLFVAMPDAALEGGTALAVEPLMATLDAELQAMLPDLQAMLGNLDLPRPPVRHRRT